MNLYEVLDHERRVIAEGFLVDLLETLYRLRDPEESRVSGLTIERLPPEDRLTIDDQTRTVAEWAAEADPGEVLLTEPRPEIGPPFGTPGVKQP